MSKDIIYREDAIKEIEEYIVKENEAISEYPDDIFKYNSGLLTAIQAVHDLPSADRPQGEWFMGNRPLEGKFRIFRCSVCGYEPFYKGEPITPTNMTLRYCPNCGARMICKHEEAEHL